MSSFDQCPECGGPRFDGYGKHHKVQFVQLGEFVQLRQHHGAINWANSSEKCHDCNCLAPSPWRSSNPHELLWQQYLRNARYRLNEGAGIPGTPEESDPVEYLNDTMEEYCDLQFDATDDKKKSLEQKISDLATSVDEEELLNLSQEQLAKEGISTTKSELEALDDGAANIRV